jgi:hypothetical protein
VKKVKKVGSAFSIPARLGTLPMEFDGEISIAHTKANPEEYKLYEECEHEELRNRRIRGELYDVSDEEEEMVCHKCDELLEYKHQVLDKKYPQLGGKVRTPFSPRARDFFKLRPGAKHAPKLTRSSRSLPPNVPGYVSELRDQDYPQLRSTTIKTEHMSCPNLFAVVDDLSPHEQMQLYHHIGKTLAT